MKRRSTTPIEKEQSFYCSATYQQLASNNLSPVEVYVKNQHQSAVEIHNEFVSIPSIPPDISSLMENEAKPSKCDTLKVDLSKSLNILNGDCLELMKLIPDSSIDLICCDLPYGTTACPWDAIIPFNLLWEQYRRILKKNAPVILFGSQPFTTALIASNLPWFKYEWVWVKNRPTNFAHAKNKPMKKHENICVFSEGTTVHASQSLNRMPYNPQGLIPIHSVHKRSDKENTDVCFSKRKSHRMFVREATNYPHSVLTFSTDQRGIHPTAKPVELLEYLVNTYSNTGAVVLDNCMGSGSTGMACIRSGRKFVGIEKNQKYFEAAKLWFASVRHV